MLLNCQCGGGDAHWPDLKHAQAMIRDRYDTTGGWIGEHEVEVAELMLAFNTYWEEEWES
ncbi:hypothetical protein LCGC14_2796280 [marine sediment metagenome]|uniref:Uncharacterized protein n=1 Tax=marine sediment metagenome TaxID=412755 RepID=A0A0F8YP34_9ZZZZ